MLMTRREMARYRLGQLVYYKIGGTLKPEGTEYGLIRMCKIVAVQKHLNGNWVYAVECPNYSSANGKYEIIKETLLAEEDQLSTIEDLY